MNWIRENKLLATFLGFVIAGMGALAFLLVQAISHFGEVDDAYKAQVEQWNQLQALPAYPEEKNLQLYKDQKKSLDAIITNLKQELSALQFPLEPMTPEEFQDKLRTTVNAVAAKAALTGAKLPEKFALGFDRYLTETPGKEAAAPLGRQLKAIEFIINEFLDNRVESITTINRSPVPEETGKQNPAKQLLDKIPVDITFVTDQNHFHKLLNDLMGTKKQFYIVRWLEVKNQVDKSPPKSATSAAAQASAKPAKDTGFLHYLFGGEKLNFAMKIEIVNFADQPQK
jgi:hypothetical protein